VRTDRWDSKAAEREVTSDAEDPRPVLLVLVIAFGRGEKGERVVLVCPLAQAPSGQAPKGKIEAQNTKVAGVPQK